MRMNRYEYLKPINFKNIPNGFIRFRKSHLFLSESGLVWNGISGCFEKGNMWEGYIRFTITIKGEKVVVGLHRMLAECFIPNPKKYKLVRHLNDIRLDNRIGNLAWGTDGDNIRDAFKNGTMHHTNHASGEKSGRAKLSEQDVLEIRKKVKTATIRKVAAEYSVSNSTIERISNRKIWTNI